MIALFVYLAPLIGILALYCSARRLDALTDEPAGDASLQSRHHDLGERRRAPSRSAQGAAAIAASACFVSLLLFLGAVPAFAFAIGTACAVAASHRAAVISAGAAVRMAEARRVASDGREMRIGALAASAVTASSLGVAMLSLGVMHWFFAHPSDSIVLASFALGPLLFVLVHALAAAPAAADSARDSAATLVDTTFAGHCTAIVAAVLLAGMSGANELYMLGDGRVETLVVQAQLMGYPLVVALIAGLVSLATSDRPRAAHGDRVRRRGGIAMAAFLLASFLLTAGSDLSHGIWLALLAGCAAGLCLETFGRGQGRADASMTATDAALPLVVMAATLVLAYATADAYGTAIAGLGAAVTSAGLRSGGLVAAMSADAAVIAGPGDESAKDSPRRVGSGAEVSRSERARGLTAAAMNFVASVATGFALFLGYHDSVDLLRARHGLGPMRILLDDPRVLIGMMAGSAVAATIAVRMLRGDVAISGNVSPLAVSVAAAPALVGLMFGPQVLGGVLAGLLVSATLLSALIGAGAGRQRGSFAPAVAVDGGQAVAGLNVLMKWMSIVALVISPLLVR